MNDTERAALVEELAEAMYETAPVVLSGHGVGDSIVIPWDSDELDESHRCLARESAASILPIIDRLITTRPEPAADMVDQVAKALADHAAVEGENWYVDDDGTEHFPKWDDLPDEESYLGGDQEWPNPGRNHFRAKARAALAAVEPEPGLDELLDSVSPEATVSLHYVSMPMADDPDPYWRAQVRVPLAGFVGNHMYEGTGATRMAAIADAVRQAKENGDE